MKNGAGRTPKNIYF